MATVAMSGTAASVDRLHEHPLAAIITGAEDPSAAAGVDAQPGTIFVRVAGTVGSLFVKVGPAAVNWKLVTTAA